MKDPMRQRLFPSLTFLRARLAIADESGWALVVAMSVMIIMLGVGLAIAATADTQINAAGKDRVRESALNLAEGALTAQQYRLPYDWPSSQNQYPSQCPNPLNASDSRCPNSAALLGAAGLFTKDTNGGAEFTNGSPTWVTRVRDDDVKYPGAGWNDYTTGTNSNARYDANGDNRMWVRADGWIGRCASPPVATATCKRRALVGLVNLETFQESFPSNVLTTGGFTITPNSKNQTYVCVYGTDPTTGNCATGAATPSQVVVRCTPVPGVDGTSKGLCEGYTSGQIVPDIVTSGGVTVKPAMDTNELGRFIKTAQLAGTYCRAGTPAGAIANFCTGDCPDLSKAPAGSYVVIDATLPTTTCSYTGNDTYNIAMLIMTDGMLKLGGGTIFNGLIYHTHGCSPTFPSPNDVTGCPASLVPGTAANPQVDIEGTAHVNGGIAVDGMGFTVLGSSSAGALSFNPNAVPPLVTFGAAGLVQSTWRELPANQQ
jgi:Tfp pilus assembly protein PilX